jgi:hypothetical protein
MMDRLPICLRVALSNDVPMSPPKDNDRRADAARDPQGELPGEDQGVLSKLPRTRPQRSSPRRAAARAASASTAAAARRDGARAPRASAAATVEPAPRQGFECEGERAAGTVHPPGGADLIASAAEMLGELAKGGVSKGERLLKDFLSHLPLS